MSDKDTLVEVDDEIDEKPSKTKEEYVAVETKPEAKDDERVVKKAEDDHEDDTPDEDPEREAIRQRRRKEKIDRKERREAAMARDKLEMEFLRKRNDDLERRVNSVEEQTNQRTMSDIDQRLAAAIKEAQMAEQVIAKAVSAGNGEDVTTAMRYRDQAINNARELQAYKQNAAQHVERTQQPQVDPRVMSHAQKFLNENKWYDPQGRNEESAIVLAIDQGLMRDGYDPQTPDYWDELRARAARRLPDKFSADRDDQDEDEPAPARKPRGGPAVGSGREHAPASTRREVYISPERKQALVDAGVWDDPILRAKFVRRYAQYDKDKRA